MVLNDMSGKPIPMPGFFPQSDQVGSKGLHSLGEEFIRKESLPEKSPTLLFLKLRGLVREFDEAIQEEDFAYATRLAMSILECTSGLVRMILDIPEISVVLKSYGIYDVDSLISWKYPGKCQYCKERPCGCSHRRRKDGIKETPLYWLNKWNIELEKDRLYRPKPENLAEWRMEFAQIYNNHFMTFRFVTWRLSLELGEASKAMYDLIASKSSQLETILALTTELADVVAWTFAAISKMINHATKADELSKYIWEFHGLDFQSHEQRNELS